MDGWDYIELDVTAVRGHRRDKFHGFGCGDNEIIKMFIPVQAVHLQVCQLIEGGITAPSPGANCLRQASAVRSAGTRVLECKHAYYLLTLVDLKWRLSP